MSLENQWNGYAVRGLVLAPCLMFRYDENLIVYFDEDLQDGVGDESDLKNWKFYADIESFKQNQQTDLAQILKDISQ